MAKRTKKLFVVNQGGGSVAVFSNRKHLWEGITESLGSDVYHNYETGRGASYATLARRLKTDRKAQVENAFGEVTTIRQMEMNKLYDFL